MIKVVPPKGWVIPETEAPQSEASESKLNSIPPSAADSGKVTDSNFDFDDIDQLLAKPDEVKSASKAATRTNDGQRPASKQSQPGQQPSIETVSPGKKTKRSQSTETNSDPGANRASSNDPMLPNQQWESDKSKSKKRLVRMLALVLGTLLLGGFIVALTIANRKKPPTPVAEKVEKADDNDAETEANNAESKDAQPTDSQDDIEPEPREADPNSELAKQDSQDPTSNAADPGSDSGTLITQSAPPKLPGTATQLPAPDPTTPDPSTEDPKQSPHLPSPFRNAETETPADVTPEPAKQQGPVGMVAKIENQMGDLAGLLEKSGASLNDLRDVAVEASGQSIVGMPKYVIEKPGAMKPDL